MRQMIIRDSEQGEYPLDINIRRCSNANEKQFPCAFRCYYSKLCQSGQPMIYRLEPLTDSFRVHKKREYEYIGRLTLLSFDTWSTVHSIPPQSVARPEQIHR